jgi:hexosaminidase
VCRSWPFPRALAIAETGWSPAARKNWTDFAARLGAETVRAKALGEVSGRDRTCPLRPRRPNSRASQELTLCSANIALNLEDDAPIRGPRARFLVDILKPCWIWQAADLAGVTGSRLPSASSHSTSRSAMT